jgi:outer membrane immunogenic protein
MEGDVEMKRIFIGVITVLAIAVGVWPITPALAQPYNWTGLYLGGQVGAQWMNSRSSFNFPGNPGLASSGSKTFHDTSAMGGGQVGFNFQPPGLPLVFGAEGDLIGASHDESGVIFRYGNGVDHFDGRSELDVQGSIRGRLGWTLNRVLLYATSGVGFGAGKVTTTATRDGVGSANFGKSETLVGWTVGGGVEYALPFSSHWLIRAEYRYTDLGSINLSTPGITFPAAAGPWTAKANFRTQNATFGVNFKF